MEKSQQNIQHRFNEGFVNESFIQYVDLFDDEFSQGYDQHVGQGLSDFDGGSGHDSFVQIDVRAGADSGQGLDAQAIFATLSALDVAGGLDQQSAAHAISDWDAALWRELWFDIEKGFSPGPDATHSDEGYNEQLEALETGVASSDSNGSVTENLQIEVFQDESASVTSGQAVNANFVDNEVIEWLEFEEQFFGPELPETFAWAEQQSLTTNFKLDDDGVATETEVIGILLGAPDTITATESQTLEIFSADAGVVTELAAPLSSFASTDKARGRDRQMLRRGGPIVFGYGDSYRIEVFKDTPLAYWRFNETSGNFAYDQVTQEFGVYVGGVSIRARGVVTGPDNSIYLNGNGRVQFGDPDNLSFDNDSFAIELWVSSNNQSGTLVEKENEYKLYFDQGVLRAEAYSEDGLDVYRNAVLLTQRTNHIVWTANGTTSQIYVNAHPVSEFVKTGASLHNTTGPLTVGDGVTGYLDELAVYSAALSEESIKRHFYIGADFQPFIPLMLASQPASYWPLNDVPSVEYDFSPEPNFFLTTEQVDESEAAEQAGATESESVTLLEEFYDESNPFDTTTEPSIPPDESIVYPDEEPGSDEVERVEEEPSYQEAVFSYEVEEREPVVVPVSIAEDVTANDRDGVPGPAVEFGREGVSLSEGSTSAQFDGTVDSYIAMPEYEWSAAPYTVAVWARAYSLPGTILKTKNWTLGINSAGVVELSGAFGFKVTGPTVQTNEWHCYAFRVDDVVTLFVDGEPVASSVYTVDANATFTRSSTAWLEGVEYAASQPRYAYGRNLISYKQSMFDDTGNWTHINGTFADSGFKFNHAVNSAQIIYGNAPVRMEVGKSYTLSCKYRRGDGQPPELNVVDDVIRLNIQNQLVLISTDGVSGPDSEGWYTLSATRVIDSAGHRFGVAAGTNLTSVTTDHYVKKIQLEEGTLSPWRPGGPSAVLIEESTTNLAAVNHSWGVSSSTYGSNTAETSTDYARVGPSSRKCVYQNDIRLYGTSFTAVVGQRFNLSCYVLIPEDYDGEELHLYSAGPAFINNDLKTIDMSVRGQWQLVTSVTELEATDTAGILQIRSQGTNPTPGKFIYVDAPHIEQRTYRTSWHPGQETRQRDILTANSVAPTISRQSGTIEVDYYVTDRFVSGTAARYFIDTRPTSTSNNYILLWASAGTLRAVTGDGQTAASIAYPRASLPLGWNRFAVTWSQSSNIAQLIVNGAVVGTSVFRMPNATLASLGVGANFTGGSGQVDGVIGGVRISNRVRTPSELADWRRALTAGTDSVVVMDFRSMSVAGSAVTDYGPSALTVGQLFEGNVEHAVYYDRAVSDERLLQQYEVAWAGKYALRAASSGVVVMQEIGYDAFTYTTED